MKPISLPHEIFRILENLEPADRGLAYSAIFKKLYEDTDPDMPALPAAVRLAYEFTMLMLRNKKRVRTQPVVPEAKPTSEVAHEADDPTDFESRLVSDPVLVYDIPSLTACADAEPISDTDCISEREVLPESSYINFSHLETMQRFSDNIFRRYKHDHQRKHQLRKELHRLYPGQYKDIVFDALGRVSLLRV